MNIWRQIIVFCLALSLAGLVHAERSLHAEELSTAPTMDGVVLGDPVWQALPYASGFTQVRPFDGEPASQRTHVYVGFTATDLYIGVICHDTDPDAIVITDARRDAPLADTDSFQVILDAFHDQQNGFVFGTTPSGAEYDGQVANEGAVSFGSSGEAFNLNWDTTWAVRSHVGDFGWSAEFRIPFKSLRYGADSLQNWGINFQRNIRRNNEVAYWSPIPRQYNLYRVSQAGVLSGIAPPAQRNLKFTPYVLGLARRGGAVANGTQYDEEVGFDAKWSITPGLTLDATYNTDFAQVEVDELQVNLDRFSLFFPEKRPFFLENAGNFAVGTPEEVELFFSRRIGVGAGGVQQPIDGGLRVSGKIGAGTNIGLLHMRSEQVDGLAPQNDYTVARVRQEFANRSELGVLFVNRDGDGSLTGREATDYNRTYAVDGQLGIGKYTDVLGYVAATETPGRRSDDRAYRVLAQYNSPAWSNSVGYTKVGANFNPEVGFLRRRDYEKAEALTFYRYRPRDWWGLYELRPHIAWRSWWDGDGFWETGFLHVDNHWEWHNGFELHTGVNFKHEGVQTPFEINPGTFVMPGKYDDEEVQLVMITDEGKPLALETTLFQGGFFGGDRTRIDTSVHWRWGERFSSTLTWNYNDIDLPVANGKFEVNVARLRVSYAFTPKILLQALVQHDDRTDLLATNIRFSWLQSANAGLYLVYNEVDDETVRGPIKKQREFAIKYSRIIDLL